MITLAHSLRLTAVAFVLSLGMIAGAKASALVDVQFTWSQSPSSYSGGAVLGTGGDLWNNFSGPFGPSVSGSGLALTDTSGAATGITLSYSGLGFYNATGGNGIFESTPYAALLDSYLFAHIVNTGPGTVTLTGLTAGTQYQLVLYSVANAPGRTTDFTANGVSESVTPTSTAVLADGVNYADLTVTADALGMLNISFVGLTASELFEGNLNGLQLEALPPRTQTPEPPSVWLFGLALVSIAVARRSSLKTRTSLT